MKPFNSVKKMSSGSFNVIYKMYLDIIYLLNMYKEGLALNDLRNPGEESQENKRRKKLRGRASNMISITNKSFKKILCNYNDTEIYHPAGNAYDIKLERKDLFV